MLTSISTNQTPESLSSNFNQHKIVDSNTLLWLVSLQEGVERRMLDRVGLEQARATSIVKYERHSSFPSHTHGTGEEFLVLKVTFCDEHGSYPSGTYVRNPPGSRHAPYTNESGVIYVKLLQMQAEGEPLVQLDTQMVDWQPGKHSGQLVKPLLSNPHERVTLEWLDSGISVPLNNFGGVKILVLSGSVSINKKELKSGSCLRLPGAFAGTLTSTSRAQYKYKREHLLQ